MPSYAEIEDYARARDSVVNPREFWEHYQNNGWRHNGAPVYNWRALFQSWERVEKKKHKPQVRPDYADSEDISPERRAALIEDIELAKEAIRECSTMDEAARYYHERTKL